MVFESFKYKELEKQGLSVSSQKKEANGKSAEPGMKNSVQGAAGVPKVVQLQKTCGNQFVQRALGSIRLKEEDSVNPDVERKIDQARGGGRPMDSDVQANMENSFGADFGGVRIHTGAHAESLNRSLSAKAFTTGRDIFFGEGHYNPGSSAGRELLAHELTHVVQQSDEIRPKLSLGQPDDEYEQEADSVARAVMRMEDGSVSRQPEEEEEPLQAKRK
jgi:hypothetical protein